MKKILLSIILIWAISSGVKSQVTVSGSIEHMTYNSGGEFHCVVSGGSGDYKFVLSSPFYYTESFTGDIYNLPTGIYIWQVEEYVYNPVTSQTETIYHTYPSFEILYVSGVQKKTTVFKYKSSSFGFKPKRSLL